MGRLTLRQKEEFLSVLPVGSNQFGAQYERVLPASSVANLYPFNFSGKTDPQGLYIGRDKYGTNILVDFDRRVEDKTTSSILILGNSGQGKSYPEQKSVSLVNEFLSHQIVQWDIPHKSANKMQIAVDEIYSNIMRYSGADTALSSVAKMAA